MPAAPLAPAGTRVAAAGAGPEAGAAVGHAVVVAAAVVVVAAVRLCLSLHLARSQTLGLVVGPLGPTHKTHDPSCAIRQCMASICSLVTC